jgi:FKBP-type peptidyl-prolyl cis-trans isomerase (trigger factor)
VRKAQLALWLAAAAGVGACELPGTVPANVAVVVDGVNVPMSRYDHVVETTKLGLGARGIPLDTNSVSGQARLKSIRSVTIRGLVHEVVINTIARQRNIHMTDQELNQAVNDVAQALGGKEALVQRLDQAGETDQDFRDQLRLTRLQAKLRAADPSYDRHFNDAVKAAQVKAYAPPCDQDHEYPRCIGGQA